jgi:Domain of unknown function (DUF4145)
VPCGHCQFPGSLERKISEAIERDYLLDQYGNEHGEWVTVMEVHQCPNCAGYSLSLYGSEDSMSPDEVNVRLIYPQPRDISALPPRVRTEYEKAQRVRGIDPDYFAVGIRRTLEAVCDERGVPRETPRDSLYARLQRLAQAGSLPETFVGMADHLKDLGNLGAHPGEIALDRDDVDVAADFMEAILEYLYRAPGQLEAVRDRLQRRKDAIADAEDPPTAA